MTISGLTTLSSFDGVSFRSLPGGRKQVAPVSIRQGTDRYATPGAVPAHQYFVRKSAERIWSGRRVSTRAESWRVVQVAAVVSVAMEAVASMRPGRIQRATSGHALRAAARAWETRGHAGGVVLREAPLLVVGEVIGLIVRLAGRLGDDGDDVAEGVHQGRCPGRGPKRDFSSSMPTRTRSGLRARESRSVMLIPSSAYG